LDTNDVAMDSETVSLVTANDDEPTSETDEARALAGDNPAERVAQGIFEALSTGKIHCVLSLWSLMFLSSGALCSRCRCFILKVRS
jgi:hypothetical protein